MPSAVLVEGLTKDVRVGWWRRRTRRALDDVSFDVPRGTVFGLLGSNGAGKSTTFGLLVDLIRPSAGRVEVLGLPPGSLIARRRVGFLPENPALYDHLTAVEFLAYVAGLCGLGRRAGPTRAADVLDRVGVGSERELPLRRLSKGMRQRVGLAQALVHDPELLILDEPMSGLDPVARHCVRELILTLRDEGRTVLFSSHVLSDAERLCSRIAILSRGRLVMSGSVTALTNGARAHSEGGWEIVANGVGAQVAERLRRRVRHLREIADGRYRFELPAAGMPEPFVAELAAAGARLVSVAPIARSLEDAFFAAVAAEPCVHAARPPGGAGRPAVGSS